MKYLYILLCCSFCFVANNIGAQDLNPSQWPNLKGYWKFQNASQLTKATVGNDLELVGSHQMVKGPSLYDTAIRIGIGSYYKCRHNIPPNGGGDSVNRYTLMFDFKVLSLKKWHTFYQTDTNNLNDGECFIRPITGSGPGRIGTATTGYTTDSVTPGKWYRLVVSVNLGHFYRFYLNGDLILEGDTQDIDDRFALNPYFLLFADNNQEDDTIDIASVAVFDTCLSTADIAKIGTIDPCVLHPMKLSLGQDTTLCGNESITKQLGYGYAYKWSTGDTASTITFNSAKMGTGLKSIWVTKTDINGCILRDTIKMGFYAKPNLNLGKDSSFCEGKSIKITAGPASNNSYEWKHFPTNTIVSKVNNITTDSTGIYMVKMSNQFGCSSYDSIKITVHPNPAKPIINYSSNSLCVGDTAFVYGPSGKWQYVWSNFSNDSSLIFTQSTGLSLRVISEFGCFSPISDSLSITFNPLPSKPEILFSGDTSFCDGDSVILFVNGTFDKYIWNDGYDRQSRIVKQTGTFNLEVENAFACKSEISNEIRTREITRPDNPKIESSNGTDLCEGDSTTLRCISNGKNLFWSNGLNDSAIKIHKTSKIVIRVSNASGCFSLLNDSIQVTFHKIPEKPEIRISIPDSIICLNIANHYRWYKEGVLISDSTKSIKAEWIKNYQVQIRDTFCWSPKSDTLLFAYENISNELTILNALNIYPNPSSDHINISLNSFEASEIVTSVIYDIRGQNIMNVQIVDGMIDIESLSAGNYFIIIHTEKGNYLGRFSKS